MGQLNFDFNDKTSYSADDFVVVNANISAFNFISHYNNGKNLDRIFAISGEKGCGKTHLAHIWKKVTHAVFLPKNKLESTEFETLIAEFIEAGKSYILENIDDITNEHSLLFLFNLVNEKKANLLITSRIPLKDMNFKIADLKSRIQNILNFVISNPDDELIRILLIKQFSDYQLAIDSNVIEFLLPRINRSFAEVSRIVGIIKDNSKGRRVTIPMIKEMIFV